MTDSAVVGLSSSRGVEIHAALVTEDPESAQAAIAWANEQLAEHQRVRGFTVWPEEDFPRTHTLKVKKQVVIDAITGNAPEQRPASPAKRVRYIWPDRTAANHWRSGADRPVGNPARNDSR